jgi:hypothetical protein
VTGHKTSKVSLLLEEATRLKESHLMDDDDDQPRAPSSSSPLPPVGHSLDDADESPSRKAPPAIAISADPPQHMDVDNGQQSDDFDDDFDEDGGEFHDLMASTAAMLDGGQNPPAPDDQLIDDTAAEQPTPKDDEFDDDAISEGDWDIAAASLANTNPDGVANTTAVPQPEEPVASPSSDYGGDSDDLLAFDSVDSDMQLKSQRERVCIVHGYVNYTD